jgi:multidrug efflux pump subunit AcrA (membrane-fusion protein)
MKLELVLLFVALVAFAYNFSHQQPISLSFDIKNPLAPEDATLQASASTDIGPLKLAYQASWGKRLSSKLSFDLKLKQPTQTVEVRFTTDSLKGVLVKEGQWVKQGQLLGIKSIEIQEEIKELENRLKQPQDELIQAEIQQKIEELRGQNEIRSLVSGYIRAIWFEQRERELTAHLLVVVGL